MNSLLYFRVYRFPLALSKYFFIKMQMCLLTHLVVRVQIQIQYQTFHALYTKLWRSGPITITGIAQTELLHAYDWAGCIFINGYL